LDETLVPHDVALERTGNQLIVHNQIIDDEIRERFAKISDRRITAVVDACYSGSSTRGTADAGQFLPGTVKNLSALLSDEERKGIENAQSTVMASLDARAQLRLALAPEGPPASGFITRSDNVIAWSATTDNQLALVDTEGAEPQSVFTRHFIAGIRDKRADRSGDGVVSFAELLDYVRKESAAYCTRNRKQCTTGLSPQLESRPELLSANVITQAQPGKAQDIALGALAHDNAAGLAVQFSQGTRVKVGQSTQFRLTTRKSGYAVLIDITPDGEMTQIYPNTHSLRSPTGSRPRANLIEPNNPLFVPDRRNPYEGLGLFEVTPPLGEGFLVAVLSDEPLKSIPLPDAPKTVGTVDEITRYVTRLAAELNRDLVVAGRPPRPRDWSVVVTRYQIER
jgi:hypothetical protein